jgi:hypothetical protein
MWGKEVFIKYVKKLTKKDQINKNDLIIFAEVFDTCHYMNQFYIDFWDGAQWIQEIIEDFEQITRKIIRQGDPSMNYLLLRQNLFDFIDIKQYPELEEFEWLILLNNAIEAMLPNGFQDWKRRSKIKRNRSEYLRDNMNDFPIYLKKALEKSPSSELKLIETPDKLGFVKYKELFDFLNLPLVIFKQNIVEIEQTEKRLGVKFPEAVKEWYSIFGSGEIFHRFSFDKSLKLSKLEVDVEIVEFIRNGDQYCFGYGFSILEQEDPSVYFWNEESDDTNAIGKKAWKKTGEKFSDFVHNYILNSFFGWFTQSWGSDGIFNSQFITFNEETTRIKFVKCLKKDFKKIDTTPPTDTVFSSNSVVITPNLTEYYHSSPLEMYIHIYSAKSALCYYKSIESMKKFLSKIHSCLDISQTDFKNLFP